MEKFVEVTYLYDIYQTLLTDKQQDLLSAYYFDDLSLGELAQQHQISRQSVFDTIKKGEHKLIEYEKKLGIWHKYQSQDKILTDMKKAVDTLTEEVAATQQDTIQTLKTLINQLSSEM